MNFLFALCVFFSARKLFRAMKAFYLICPPRGFEKFKLPALAGPVLIFSCRYLHRKVHIVVHIRRGYTKHGKEAVDCIIENAIKLDFDRRFFAV